MSRITAILISLFVVMNAIAIDYTFKNGYGISSVWEAGDKVGIFGESSRQIKFDIISTNVSDAHTATIDGNGLGLRGNKRYFALSPYSYDYYVNDNISTSLPIAFPVLTQTANGDANHLSVNDLMTAETLSSADGSATFRFSHLNAVIRLSVLVPAKATFINATLETSNGRFLRKGILNIENRQTTAIEQTNTVELQLNDINVERGNILVLYFIVPITDTSGGDITATVTTTDNQVYTCSFSGINMQAGRLYNIGRTLRATASKAKQNDNSIAANHQSTLMAKAARANGDLYYPTCIAADFTIALNDEQYEPLPADYIIGDANNDGRVNVGDLTTIAAYILGKTPAVFNKDAADANKDGRINVGDLTNIANLILKSGK